MSEEIERKFLVDAIPDLSGKKSIPYERYILESKDGKEIRIQSKAGEYELEELQENSSLGRNKTKKVITKEEFEELKPKSVGSLIRESYLISERPNISVKVYHGKYEGLVRAEVEFNSLEEAESFKPLDWFGPEITDSPLGRDGRLIELSEDQFKILLQDFMGK